MVKTRIAGLFATAALFLPSFLYGGDLSQYRQFRLDSGLAEIASQAELNPAVTKLVHHRPARIEELSWRSGPEDSVKGITFSFYDGELFRMVVDYDRYNTAGLTSHDMIEALSAEYGPSAKPAAEITVPSTYGSEETVAVIARWEDPNWTFDLVRFKYEPSFALVGRSKKLHERARAAMDEATRLDRQEAPQRAIQQRKNEDAAKQAEQEEARRLNKPGFRP